MLRQASAACDKPLSLEQREFAERNHDILLRCMRNLRVPEEYYDVAAFGYLDAVCKYNNTPELWRYPFYTVCRNSIRSHVQNERSKIKRRKDTVSLDAPLGEDTALTLHEVLAAPSRDEEEVFTNITQQYLPFWGQLTIKQRQTVNLYASGFSSEQIARILGVKPSTVNSVMYESRKRIREAERKRSMILKARIEKQHSAIVSIDEFQAAEEKARRKLAVMQTRQDTTENALLPSLIIAILLKTTKKEAHTGYQPI